jgi:hypothetical protein
MKVFGSAMAGAAGRRAAKIEAIARPAATLRAADRGAANLGRKRRFIDASVIEK